MFNLFLTMPFGAYLRYYFRVGWKRALLYSFLLSLFFELTQLTGLYFVYPGSYRLFDVDDLIINTTGSMIGFMLGGIAGASCPAAKSSTATASCAAAACRLQDAWSHSYMIWLSMRS